MSPSRGCAASAARTAALFLAILFVLSSPLAMAGRAVADSLFSAQVVSGAVEEHLIESGALHQVVLEEALDAARIGENPNEPSWGQLTAHLSEDDRQRVAELVVPEVWARQQSAQLVADFFAWIDGDTALPRWELDLTPVKRRLLAGGSAEIAAMLVSSWPACTPGQLEAMQSALMGGGGQQAATLCQPPAPVDKIAIEFMRQSLEREVRSIPDVQVLTPESGQPGDAAQWRQLQAGLQTLRFVGKWSWMLPASLLGLVVALVVRSWRTWALWWGWPILAGGLLGLGVTFVGFLAGPSWLASVPAGSGVETVARTGIGGMVAELYDRAIWEYAILAGAAMGIGPLMVALAWLWPLRPADPRSASAEAVDVHAGRPVSQPGSADEGEGPKGLFG